MPLIECHNAIILSNYHEAKLAVKGILQSKIITFNKELVTKEMHVQSQQRKHGAKDVQS